MDNESCFDNGCNGCDECIDAMNTTPTEAPSTVQLLRLIEGLSAGWDEHGSTGPREPYSWETVARMAMDYARAALSTPPAEPSSDTPRAVQPAEGETRRLIQECCDALAEELAGWDLSPPLHHVKQAHDRCVAWLASPPPEAQAPNEPWEHRAAEWLRMKSREQEGINAAYPDHVACYPSWRHRVLDRRWLADELDAMAAGAEPWAYNPGADLARSMIADGSCASPFAATPPVSEQDKRDAVHAAISRALLEGGVTHEALCGMCIEVGLEAFDAALKGEAP